MPRSHSPIPSPSSRLLIALLTALYAGGPLHAQEPTGHKAEIRSTLLTAEPGYRISFFTNSANAPLELRGGQLMGKVGVATISNRMESVVEAMAMAPNGLLRQLGMGKYQSAGDATVSAELYELGLRYTRLWRVAGRESSHWNLKVGAAAGGSAFIANYYLLNGRPTQTANLACFASLDAVLKIEYGTRKADDEPGWWIDARVAGPIFMAAAQGKANANFPQTVFVGNGGVGEGFQTGLYNGYHAAAGLGITRVLKSRSRLRLSYQWSLAQVGSPSGPVQSSTYMSHSVSLAIMACVGWRERRKKDSFLNELR